MVKGPCSTGQHNNKQNLKCAEWTAGMLTLQGMGISPAITLLLSRYKGHTALDPSVQRKVSGSSFIVRTHPGQTYCL